MAATVVHDREAWVAAGGDLRRLDILATVGKVATFSDGDGRILAAIHPARPDVGTVGDWVGAPSLLRAAERWLAEQGCSAAAGPALMAPWFPYRANEGPYDQPPLALEPTERGTRWADAGYVQVARYASIVTAHDAQIKAGVAPAGALGTRGWRIEHVETGPSSSITEATFDRVMAIVYDLACRAYADVDGYLPVPLSAVADWYRPIASSVDPRLSLLAFDPSGKPAAFVLGVPDFVQPERKWFQILAIGVAPEHRNTGVGTWLVAASHQAARRAGFVAGVHAQIRMRGEGQDGSTWLRGDVIRRYALYQRSW